MAVKSAGGHGGNIYAAARDLRTPVRTVLDFSASINPLGPSTHVGRMLAQSVGLIRHYPDPDCASLRQILASRWNLSPAHFVIGNGSTELIDLIPRALRIRSSLIVGPTFSEYAEALRRAGARSRTLFAMRDDGYRPPLENVLRCLRRDRTTRHLDAVFLCNPNSPTGQACDRSALMSCIEQVNGRDTWMILDETFVEYCDEQSMLPWLSQYPRLIVLRSFTKFYALPGLRVGYSVSSPRAAAALRQCQPPWSVNVMAQHAAATAVQDRGHAKRSFEYLQRERERFAKRLSSLSGVTVFPSWANFLLLELPRPHRAKTVAVALRRQKLLIRDCSLVPGLNPWSVRVAVRTKAENDRLVAAFERVLR